MPYVTAAERKELQPSLRLLVKDLNDADFTPGQLNFVLCSLANAFVKRHGLSYNSLDSAAGAFTLALGEFERRVVHPYEDIKVAVNGDVFDCLEPETPVITNDWLEDHMIRDEATKQTWFKCYEGNCDLHLVGPGVVACDNCSPDDDPDFQRKA